MKKIIALFILGTITLLGCSCFYIPKANGIDVSHHNTIDWNQFSKSDHNIKFVYIKATKGSTFQDPKFLYNVENAKNNGILVGGYHYFSTKTSGESQFRNFSKELDKVHLDLIPVIDIEKQGNDFTNTQEVRKNLGILIKLLETKYKCKPIIYYGSNVIQTVFTETYNCKSWIRFLEYSKYLCRIPIQQIGCLDTEFGEIDSNYCYNLEKILLK